MSAVNAQFEPFDTAQVPTGGIERGSAAGFDIDRSPGIRRFARKYKNRGNEAKKYLETKDISFLDAANYARFALKLA